MASHVLNESQEWIRPSTTITGWFSGLSSQNTQSLHATHEYRRCSVYWKISCWRNTLLTELFNFENSTAGCALCFLCFYNAELSHYTGKLSYCISKSKYNSTSLTTLPLSPFRVTLDATWQYLLISVNVHVFSEYFVCLFKSINWMTTTWSKCSSVVKHQSLDPRGVSSVPPETFWNNLVFEKSDITGV